MNRKNRAIAKFWANKAFRTKVIKAAQADGKLPQAINPENLALILKFIVELLPYILKLFV
jgi:hypothetical protein